MNESNKLTDTLVADRSFTKVALGVLVVAFGLLIPWLGFYWDDWMILYFMKFGRTPADSIVFAYRPLHAFIDHWQFRLFGFQPLLWHVYSLAVRFLAVLLAHRLVRRLWPARAELAFWTGLLFAVYPAFQSQAMAVVYRQHWTGYALFLISLLCMLSPGTGKRRAFLEVAGVAALLAELLITEYLIGLEAVRPLLMWWALAVALPEAKARARAVLARWWPYLLAGIAFLVWRLAFIVLPEDPNPPVLLDALRAAPLAALLGLAQTAARDFVQILWVAWADLMQPDLLDLSDRFGLLAWAVGAGVAVWLYRRGRGFTGQPDPKELRAPMLLGALLMPLGLAAIWLVGRSAAAAGLFADRLTLAALLGASLFVAAALMALIPRTAARALAFSLLIGLAVSGHLRTANDFRWDWTLQKRFFSQLAFRAPGIEPGTLLILDGAVTRTLSRYNTTFAVNILYGGVEDPARPRLWAEEFYTGLHRRIDEFAAGASFKAVFQNVSFEGNTNQSLLLVGPPDDETRCWWLLTERDTANWQIPEELRTVAAYADTEAAHEYWVDFQEELRDFVGGCRIFQVADLYRQNGAWTAVNSGLDEDITIEEEDITFSEWIDTQADGYEFLPFIEASLRLGNWEDAEQLTITAYKRTLAAQSMLCATWAHIVEVGRLPGEFAAAWENVIREVRCP
ncbi:MAG: hypothetical protein EPO32_07520 [Anaerolineae bacterium]|nr:MAG: hypothetical protein EPO32_07520 [Anaerolineae bacterium]